METLKDVDTHKAKVSGICITCIHQDECAIKNQIDTDIWFCDEFDDYITPENIIHSGAKTNATDVENSKTLSGLCANCEIRHNCIHAKKTGGVWFCEQYE